MEPQVSVIIPAYNAEHFLRRSVGSVLAQSMTRWELIIVDDGSTDGTPQLADELAATDPRISVVHKRHNAGLAEARRTGHQAATGTYHLHLDADDTLPGDALQFLLSKALDNDLDFIIAGTYRIVGDKRRLIDQRSWEKIIDNRDQVMALIFDYRFRFTRGICFSRGTLWEQYDVFPPHDEIFCSEDYIITTKLLSHCSRVGVYNHPIYNYYLTQGSLSISKKYTSHAHIKKLVKALEQELRNINLFNTLEQSFHDFVLSFVTFEIKETERDEWLDEITHYDVRNSSLKIKVCRFLLRHEWLRRPVVALHNYLYRLRGI